MEFFKKSWNTFKQKNFQVFHYFFLNNVVNNNVKETYIALIAKTLVERLKQTLCDTIFENQLAFVKGRQITNVILMANEAMDY